MSDSELTQDAAPQAAYNHFNLALFDGLLPWCLVQFHHGGSGPLGYHNGSVQPKIFLHRGFYLAIPAPTSLQWLVHEMIHAWQFRFGSPAPNMEHNAEFSDKSIAIGLIPTATGNINGARTGPLMLDYAMGNGRFSAAAKELVPWWAKVFPISESIRRLSLPSMVQRD